MSLSGSVPFKNNPGTGRHFVNDPNYFCTQKLFAQPANPELCIQTTVFVDLIHDY